MRIAGKIGTGKSPEPEASDKASDKFSDPHTGLHDDPLLFPINLKWFDQSLLNLSDLLLFSPNHIRPIVTPLYICWPKASSYLRTILISH